MNNKKHYFIPGVDELKQLVETPASRQKTEDRRFVFSTIVSVIAAVAAVIAAIVSILVYIKA